MQESRCGQEEIALDKISFHVENVGGGVENTRVKKNLFCFENNDKASKKRRRESSRSSSNSESHHLSTMLIIVKKYR